MREKPLRHFLLLFSFYSKSHQEPLCHFDKPIIYIKEKSDYSLLFPYIKNIHHFETWGLGFEIVYKIAYLFWDPENYVIYIYSYLYSCTDYITF